MKTLKKGSTGQEVKNAQIALNFHLPDQSPPLAEDGVFGPKTLARVILFQERNNLNNPPKGVIGPQTHRALYSFVECRHHILFIPVTPLTLRRHDPSPHPPPPRPVLPIPFPWPFRPVTPLTHPRFKFNLADLLGMSRTDFELQAGQATTYSRTLQTHETERRIIMFTEVAGVVWSKPIGEHFEASAGQGIAVERHIGDDEVGASAFVFGKLQLKDVLKLGPLDIFKLETEARVEAPVGDGDRREPPDMSFGFGLRPAVSFLHDTLSFGPNGYLGVQVNREGVKLKAQVGFTGTYRF